jgi:uncharacterized protein YoxC
MTNKGFVFIIDVVIALVMIILLINIYSVKNNNYKEYEIVTTVQQINDLLITSQILELNENEIVENAKKLFNSRRASITINNKITNINPNFKYSEKISNSIRYINSSNKEIYIEVTIFY